MLLQAFQKHKLVDVFYQPGLSDLTANVDFAYLEEAIASTCEWFWGFEGLRFGWWITDFWI